MGDIQTIVSGAVDESDPPERRAISDVAVEGALLIPNTVKLVIRLVRDPRVSIRWKLPVGAAFVYAISPIAIGPRSARSFGMLDDVVIMSLALNALVANTDPEIVTRSWDGSVDALDLVTSVVRWGATMVPGRS